MNTTFLNRITTGWTFVRALYLVMGIIFLVQAIGERQWMMMAFGAYFGSMGLFNYGCAAGACYTGMPSTQEQYADKTVDADYEEVHGRQ
ncbi:MAG: hypothetical protein JSS76_10185 [Bacteroidetes bacterium]|nr:hypothetical protein [Bacteroidota bacterium]MBS1685115.1 hypothetical protein [Bacteroidota bacterium]